MCGRFTQYFTWAELVELYGLTGSPQNVEERFNVAPTNRVWAIRADEKGRYASRMRWGLIPSWWKQEKPPTFTINARAEGIAQAKMWGPLFKRKRMILPMSGFYEWSGEKGSKRTFYITMGSGEPMAVAGIWDSWTGPEGEEVTSCSLITTEANSRMAEVHDRMPVILGRYDLESWLAGRADEAVLKPCPADWIKVEEVSSRVNKVKGGHDDRACIEPLNAR
ncbi:MAG: SOS response-associated peptidase [Parvibaculaceae bacterium]|nr:SOS response-associated peptidase [Parvibaculaceae bacterium]